MTVDNNCLQTKEAEAKDRKGSTTSIILRLKVVVVLTLFEVCT